MASFLSRFGTLVAFFLCGFDRLRFRGEARLLNNPRGVDSYLYQQSATRSAWPSATVSHSASAARRRSPAPCTATGARSIFWRCGRRWPYWRPIRRKCGRAIAPSTRTWRLLATSQARAGGAKAVAATARKIAERVYRLLKYGAAYVRQGIEAYEAAYQARLLRGLARRAQELGFCLVPETLAGNASN